MSQRPIGRSVGLQCLRADGYTISLLGGLLVVSDIPYVDPAGTVHDDAILVMPLTLSGDTAQAPSDHTAHFVGGIPCGRDGAQLDKIINNTNSQQLADGLIASCCFSAKPHGTGRYKDFHDKVTTYIAHISSPAQALACDVTPQRHRRVHPRPRRQDPRRPDPPFRQ